MGNDYWHDYVHSRDSCSIYHRRACVAYSERAKRRMMLGVWV